MTQTALLIADNLVERAIMQPGCMAAYGRDHLAHQSFTRAGPANGIRIDLPGTRSAACMSNAKDRRVAMEKTSEAQMGQFPSDHGDYRVACKLFSSPGGRFGMMALRLSRLGGLSGPVAIALCGIGTWEGRGMDLQSKARLAHG